MKRLNGVVLALLLAAGVALTGCTKTGDPSGSTSPSPVPANAPAVPGNVAVLVVDDFGLGKNEQVPRGSNDNCTVATTDVGSNGAGDGELPPGYPHGEAVYQVLRDQLDSLPATAANPTTTSTPRPAGLLAQVPAGQAAPPATIETSVQWKYTHAGNDYRLKLVQAHASGYRTDTVLKGVGNKIKELQGAAEKFDRFVINLSFVVIPCDTVKFLEAKELNDLFSAYNELLRSSPSSEALKKGLDGYLTSDGSAMDPAKVNDGGFTLRLLQDNRLAPLRPYLVSAYYSRIELNAKFGGQQEIIDPDLRRIYNDPGWNNFLGTWVVPGAASPSPTTPKVIPVGAAGNGLKLFNPKDPMNPTRVSLPFPFAPALWDFVASATADPPPGAAVNSGEAKLEGTGPAFAPDSHGTSYAAPRLSAYEARYLLETGRVICDGQKPPLGYVDMTRDTPVDVSTHSPWQNKPKADWPSKCTDFPIP